MSLRTKLVAAIVVLPGAALLLALQLLLPDEATTPPEAVSAVIKLVLNASDEAEFADLMLQQAESGHFEALYVVRAASDTRPRDEPAEVWTVPAYYADRKGGNRPELPDVQDDGEREEALHWFQQARTQEAPAFLLGTGYAAVQADLRAGGRRVGVVMKLRSPRRNAQRAFWFMVAGILFMMALFAWLVTRLVVRPLGDLSKAADRIAHGDYGVHIEPHDPHDELGVTARAINRMAGEIAEYQGHLEDRVLTALGRIKKAEQHLTIAQRLAATGKLASGLAHEINNPLGGMKNAVRALARGDLDEEKTALYLDLVQDGLVRIEQTVKKFLSFTPRQAEPGSTDLADVARSSVALAMHRIEKKRVRVDTVFPVPGHATVFGDQHELQQVALNLVLNAADAIADDEDGRILVEVERHEEEAVLRVSDNGAGMTPEDQAHCFDMFFTTKEVGEGSGMGLAVVHNIVTNHGGRIEVSSEVGEGTTFEVWLPGEARPDLAPPEEETPRAEPEPASGGDPA